MPNDGRTVVLTTTSYSQVTSIPTSNFATEAVGAVQQ
jgi:hypothetical protein